jgi:hypothetical protein
VWCIGGLLPAVHCLFVIDVCEWLLARALSILIRVFDRDVSLNCWTPSACESNEYFAVIRMILTCREIKLVHSESCSFLLSFSSYVAGMQPVCHRLFLFVIAVIMVRYGSLYCWCRSRSMRWLMLRLVT